MKTIPAGITWTGHGRNRTVCTIRRESQTFYDNSDFNLLLHRLRCPWCGQTQPLLGALLGGLGL